MRFSNNQASNTGNLWLRAVNVPLERDDELFVVFKSFKYLVDVIHRFKTTAKAKLHH